ncbi:aldose 1-epimerase family protein [Paenarthrobacter ureafaciens]|nr:aldose 1-epimerase family protein [Paenarthrobacter ureafaciens]
MSGQLRLLQHPGNRLMRVRLQTDQLRAVLDSHGAELVSLQNSTGKELLWSAGTQWPRHAPVLFPIIGRLANDTLHHDGRDYPMPQHGFARDNQFAVLETTAHTARFFLRNNPSTETMFPFPFTLESSWSVNGPTLQLIFTLTNTGPAPMPACLGWHPAFRWDPSPGWQLQFDEEETAAVRRVNAQVQLMPGGHPSPVHRRVLTLTEDLFTDGAIIFESVKSNTVQYVSPAGPLLDLAFDDFLQFAVWKQTDADFVCLEPWAGLPAPASYRGELLASPGQMIVQPGEELSFSCGVTAHP